MSTSLEAFRDAGGAQVEAQAKINLRLKVLARETSGFHQVQTLLLRVMLADTVRVRRTSGARSLDVTGLAEPSSIGPVEKNLAWRAADAYFTTAAWAGGFAIELEKRLPIGGGLGGGSADAGAVLRVLDSLSPTPLGEQELLRLAGTLGTDVPFLTSTQVFALGIGRGDQLRALPAPPSRGVVLLIPAFAVNTAQAYGWLDDWRGGSATQPRVAGMPGLETLGDWEALRAVADNDFERVVASHHPEITGLVDCLREFGCSPAMMSGSGSAVFGVAPDDTESRGVAVYEDVQVLGTFTATKVEPVVPLD